MRGDEIPRSDWPVSGRAPGKCVIFGEHSVVFGKPELVLAIDLYTQVGVREGVALELDGDREALAHNAYLAAALEEFGQRGTPLVLRATSRLPKAAGLGSSAAFCAALAAGLSAVGGGCSRAELHERSFAIERKAQGVGSPGDTAASVVGGYVSLNSGSGSIRWEVSEKDHSWVVRSVEDPGWIWVVAYSGVPRNTAEAVRRVGERVKQEDGPELLNRLERIASAGIQSVEREDRSAVGELLKGNQVVLRELGVSHPRLESLLDVVAPASEGAKLTGAGAGGSIVVLPKLGRELECARLLSRAGALSFVVRPAPRGAHLVASGP